jgi:hypothetical protein
VGKGFFFEWWSAGDDRHKVLSTEELIFPEEMFFFHMYGKKNLGVLDGCHLQPRPSLIIRAEVMHANRPLTS